MIEFIKTYMFSFQCGNCHAWWSLQMTEDQTQVPDTMVCPLCKVEQEVNPTERPIKTDETM